jgi:hypothetical protein
MIDFGVGDSADEVDTKQMPSSPVSAAFTEYLEYLNVSVNVFYRNTLSGSVAVIRLFFLRQRMMLTLFNRDLTVCVIFLASLITAVHLCQNRYGFVSEVFERSVFPPVLECLEKFVFKRDSRRADILLRWQARTLRT